MQNENKFSDLSWTWNGVKVKLRDLDQRQLYSIKQTLNNTNKNWFGQPKHVWNKAIEPILLQHEHMNIRHIVHQQETKRVKCATRMADSIIQMFTKNDK